MIVPASRGGFDVVTIGEPMVLLLADPGVPLRRATTFHRSVAGSESNVAVGLARLGNRVQLQTRLSTDAFGDVIRSTLRAEGVVVHADNDPDRPSGVLIRDSHPQRSIDVIYHRASSAASALGIDDLDLEAIASARILHISGITPILSDSAAAAIDRAVTVAVENATLVSFDPNLRRRLCTPEHAAERIASILARADVVLASEDEAVALTGVGGESAAQQLLELGPQLIVIKCGTEGAWATDGTTTWLQNPLPATQIDPVGAGDAFATGFLHALLHGDDVDSALAVGAAVGAMVVSVNNDVDGLPTLDELLTNEGVQR